jgi:dTDP-glucose pyrophosphorylase
MKAVILAGGFGTRLKSVVGDVPKPMASIAGKPFLEHQIRFLRRYGVKEIIIAVHHMADMIKSYFGTGHRWEVNITYSEEDVPLGTAGAIKNAEKYIDNTFIVMNGDSHSNFNLDKFIEFHRLKRSTSSLLLTRTNDPSHFGSVVIFEDKIMEFRERGTGGESMINAGVYLFEPKIFDYIDKDKNVSLEKDVFPKLIRDGQLCGVEHGGYFIDIGRPETYAKFKQDVLRNMTLRERDKVRDAMNRISKNGVDLVLITDDNMKLLGVINDKLAKKHMLAGGNIDDPLNVAMVRDIKVAKTNDSKDKVFEILRSGYRHLPIVDEQGRLSDVEFNVAKVKTETFPTVRGRAPLRISFAGGGTDLPYFFEKYGGVVINSTINTVMQLL